MIRKQSGVIPCFFDTDEMKIILVTPRWTDEFWIFPKGNIENGLTATASAAKEAFEEAGITGTLFSESVGTYRYEKLGTHYDVTFFVFLVKNIMEDYPEKNHRKRITATLAQAKNLVRDAELNILLDQAVRIAQQISSGRGNQ
ncbi:NUDIX hydrolase [bacterium]|nr:NUDIX hydrolase [bacterium]MCP5461734.1 NUDIX hydrolase [bacterium]